MSIEYFKKLIDSALNKDYLKCDLIDDINPTIKTSISQISFFDSICVIDKFHGLKNEPFKNSVVGEIALVAPRIANMSPNANDKQSAVNAAKKLFCG